VLIVLNILSIDLDWFNIYSGKKNLRNGINKFFEDLSGSMKVTSTPIVVVRDHHYLYPWCLHLLRKYNADRVSVVNIDEHHDFYNLNKYRWVARRFSKPVDCGNFFAFMAYDRILSRYDWVVSNNSVAALEDAKTFRLDVTSSKCDNIQGLLKNSTVWEASEVMKPIRNKLFHGLLISESPLYTCNHKVALEAVLKSLDKFFPNHPIRFHKCQKDFQYGHRKRIGMKRVIV